ncbi:hypothetical protein OJJOAM_000701 [Cupriavidus sp. H18C1]|uniref:hypothetical protein n=1 Tax=Cupriavidus sp. H18C1 TaxID=3241601 RepID=UPI003BB93A76
MIELAHYEVAGLVSSPDFWDAVESALRETVNRDAVGGELRLESVSQLGMNIVLAKDGKNLECHLIANWREYRQGNEWHAMSDLSPVLKARARILIGLKPGRGGHRLEASFVHLHANSPLPEIRQRLLDRQPTLGQKLLNALASIPLLGRLFRGTQIKLTIGGRSAESSDRIFACAAQRPALARYRARTAPDR